MGRHPDGPLIGGYRTVYCEDCDSWFPTVGLFEAHLDTCGKEQPSRSAAGAIERAYDRT